MAEGRGGDTGGCPRPATGGRTHGRRYYGPACRAGGGSPATDTAQRGQNLWHALRRTRHQVPGCRRETGGKQPHPPRQQPHPPRPLSKGRGGVICCKGSTGIRELSSEYSKRRRLLCGSVALCEKNVLC